MLVGGLDIGTSGCKISLYGEDGVFLSDTYREYDVSRSGGLHEIDASAVYSSVLSVIKTAAEGAKEPIGAIAVTSFGETFTVLGENNEIIAPSMLYTDPRGEEEAAALSRRFGEEALAFKTGARAHGMYSLPKMMWLKKNMPEAIASAKCILLMQDFIVYMLTGKRQIDYSLAARTLAFDIEKKCWDAEILSFAGIDERLLSEPVPTGTVAGKIRPALLEDTALSPDTLIVSGAHDQIAAMEGAGVTENTCVMDGTGTVECVPVLFDKPVRDGELFSMGYSFAPHPSGLYACYALSYTGGATLKWFRQSFSSLSYGELDKAVPKEPTSLLIMPHFSGAATPFMDSASKAAVLGLTFEHTASHIYKALMEGTAYEIMLNLEILKKHGLSPTTVVATGGGAKSDVWLQIKADVLGLTVTALSAGEVGGAGTALFAGRAIGVFDDATVLCTAAKEFRPNAERHEFYLKQFEKYKKIYKLSKEVLSDE